MDWSVVAAIAAIAGVVIGLTAYVSNLLWRRPLLTISLGRRTERAEILVVGIDVRNDGERTVRDVQAQALLDGKPFAGVPLAGSWTIAPNQSGSGEFEIPRSALGDPPDLKRLAARVSRPRRWVRKDKDVKFGESGVTLR